MKNNWIFKIPKFTSFDSSSQKETIRLEQKRNFRGEVGDRALVLQFVSGDWQFVSNYEIQEIDLKDPEAEYKVFNIRLVLISKLEDKLLDDYIFSLRRVTNFKYPINHFKNRYNRISIPEFEGILYDNIYQKRTIVGTVLNAMHRNHQESFLIYLAERDPAQLLGNADVDEVFTFLLEYLNFSIIKQAVYLSESVEILRKLGVDTKDIGLTFNQDLITGRKAQMIEPQYEIIKQYVNQMPGYNNLRLEGQFLEIDDDPKFRRLFRNTPFPITLN